MTTTNHQDYHLKLVRRASKIFPITPYTKPSTVRYNRREWVEKILILRSKTPSRWILDKSVSRKAA